MTGPDEQAAGKDAPAGYAEATGCLKRGELASAEAACRAGLAGDPAHPRWLELMALVANARRDYPAAADWMRRAVAASGKHAGRYQTLGALLMQAGDREGAKAAFLAAAACMPAAADLDRAFMAQYVRVNLGDDHAGARIVVRSDDFDVAGPFRIRLETASACNLRCQHCPTGVNYGATDRTAMKPALFERVLDSMKLLPTLRQCVLYLGGEPLLNKNLVTMCRRVKQETSVTRTFITTNGMLLDEKMCAGLATAMLDEILVSVDGRSPEENDAIRVRARYPKIVEGVARLRRHLAGTDTQVIISHAMIRRAQDPDEPYTPEFLKRDFPGIQIWSDYATRWPGFDIGKSSLAQAQLKIGNARNFCDFPFFELSVRANGEVVLCCHDLLGESVMGNVLQDDLATIWNGERYRETRRHMLARSADTVHSVCKRCFIFTGERIVRRESTDASVKLPHSLA